MTGWDGWPFARLYLLLLAVAFLVVGAQVFLYHWRAAFRSRAMYGPVVMAPIIAAAGVAAAIVRNDVVGWAAVAVFAIGLINGLVGLAMHLQGTARRIGGFTLRNLTAGPPPLLPLAFAALALTGGLAVVWEAW
ncbi:MAG: hypothetical protein M3Q48_17315 [Actinomycetota bacterium]|nr:hypothetical protein [Actinomycetota bacterium]